MSQDSNLGVYILVGLLITVLVLAIPVIAADRTVFDTGHAVDTIEDEDVYARTTVAFQDRVTELVDEAAATDSSESPPLLDDEQRRQIATAAVSESYVEAELGGHIDTAYSYLHGNRDDARFVFNLSEPKARAIAEATAVEREARAQRNPAISTPADVPSEQLVVGPSLSAEFPESQNITEAGAPPGELDTARSASSVFGILWWLLPVLGLILVVLIYYVTDRSVRRTAEATGGALVAAGLLSLIVGLGGRPIARSVAEGRVSLENPAFDSLSDGLVALVGSLFDLVLIQSGLTLIFGILLLGVVSAEANGFFESLTNGDDSTARSDEPAEADTGSSDRGGADSEWTERYAEDRASGDDRHQMGAESAEATAAGTEMDPARTQQETDSEAHTSAETDDNGAYDPEEYDEHGFKVDESADENSDERE